MSEAHADFVVAKKFLIFYNLFKNLSNFKVNFRRKYFSFFTIIDDTLSDFLFIRSRLD